MFTHKMAGWLDGARRRRPLQARRLAPVGGWQGDFGDDRGLSQARPEGTVRNKKMALSDKLHTAEREGQAWLGRAVIVISS